MSLKQYILNKQGKFGEFGGRFVPEMLVGVMEDLEKAFFEAIEDQGFIDELDLLRQDFAGRKTPLLFCENLTKELDGANIFLKNEGLLHTGAHKMNHCLGQGLLCKRMGKKRVIAETGAGQHGLATATMCAKLGLECVVYMGAKDVARQRPNVFWMEQLGATVVPVQEGGQVLRDAINAAMRDLMANSSDTHYLLGTVCGSHPYPVMNTYFQKIVGEEVKEQFTERYGKLPDYLVACVGGGSNAMGFVYDFLDDEVDITLVEAGGKGIHQRDHAARFQAGSKGVSEGMKSYFLHDEDGQMYLTHSISAGLDYSGVGPQVSYLKDSGRINVDFALDDEVKNAWKMLARTEGIFGALESMHALAHVIKIAPQMKGKNIIFNLSGRGDKDLFITTKMVGDENFKEFLRNQI
jgi:tryptophan synthase beta chain